MTLKFADNYNLFVIYLILNLSGYDDENNKKGMHPVRKKIRRYFEKHKKDEKAIRLIRKLLKKIQYNRIAFTGLLKRERPRVRKFKGLDEALLLIKEFEETVKLKEFYKTHYLPNLNNIINNKKFRRKLKKYERDISGFVEIKTNWKISVDLLRIGNPESELKRFKNLEFMQGSNLDFKIEELKIYLETNSRYYQEKIKKSGHEKQEFWTNFRRVHNGYSWPHFLFNTCGA